MIQKIKAAVDYGGPGPTDHRADRRQGHRRPGCRDRTSPSFRRSRSRHDVRGSSLSLTELEQIAKELRVPQIANIVHGGRTPDPGRAALAQMGFSIVLYANAGLQAALRAAMQVYSALKNDGSLQNVSDLLATFEERQQSVAKDSWDTSEGQVSLAYPPHRDRAVGGQTPYPTMRIEAELEIFGTVRSFSRIKLPHNSLLDDAGNTVADAMLLGELEVSIATPIRPCTVSMTRHSRPSEKAFSASKGDLGHLLFSATAGLADSERSTSGPQKRRRKASSGRENDREPLPTSRRSSRTSRTSGTGPTLSPPNTRGSSSNATKRLRPIRRLSPSVVARRPVSTRCNASSTPYRDCRPFDLYGRNFFHSRRCPTRPRLGPTISRR